MKQHASNYTNTRGNVFTTYLLTPLKLLEVWLWSQCAETSHLKRLTAYCVPTLTFVCGSTHCQHTHTYNSFNGTHGQNLDII
jgi:hypothetical protein